MSEIFHGDDPENGDDGVEHDADTAKIRELNDRFRQTLQGGTILFTAGVNALSFEQKDRIIAAIREFDAFDAGNDPWHLHDFGEVEIDGQRIWFKLDLYDANYEYGSPDPTDERVTRRVMTVLTPEEY